MARSPFTPSFGTTPPVLAGRDELIAQFAEGIDDGPGAAARATLYTGARGTGKTVLLNAAEEQARSRGWLVISETATPGFLERLASDHLPRALASRDTDALKRRLTSIQAPLNLGGVGWATDDQHRPRPSLRSQIELLTDLLAENETGLLITLDEIHHHQKNELREFGAIVQHAFREARELAFAAAALPAAIDDLLSDSVLTFLRRADRHHLERVEEDAVREALREPILKAGRSLAPPALETMVAATQGYPFLIQLIGDQVWRKATGEGEIDLPSANVGIEAARRRLGQLVHAPALAEASDIDKSFLLAMSADDGPSQIRDVQTRLGVDKNYASQYRLRLIALELVEPAGHGRLDFALPYLRDYLREHAASLGLTLPTSRAEA
ncbi:MAG TPA: ATP-binding protein [Solirubrobacteraceae bacterium]|nr:ATP-binding protein [Solirubrobacteraceae bacterium]